jgi:hypothetical protein
VQRVVQRPEVGIDLLVERAGQETEPLPRLHRRPGQDNPVDLLRLQGLHGLGHRQVRLAGTRRTDAENDGMRVDRVHVPLLVQRLRTDRPAPGGKDVEGQDLGRAFHAPAAQHRQRMVDMLRGEHRPGVEEGHQLAEELRGEGVLGRLAGDCDLVAAHVDVRGERLLDHAEELVLVAEEAHHVVRPGYDDARDGPGVRGGDGFGHEGRPSAAGTPLDRDLSSRRISGARRWNIDVTVSLEDR